MQHGVRLFQGANISLGKIKNLGRAINEFHSTEIAYLVAYYMFQNSIDNGDGRVFFGSVPQVIHNLWPEADDEHIERVKKIVNRSLRVNGFSPERIMVKGVAPRGGWRVPSQLNWNDDVKFEPSPKAKKDKVLESIVTYRCAMHPEAGSMTKEKFDKHQSRHKNGQSLGHKAMDLLELIKKRPGLHPREYAAILKISPAAVSSRAMELKHAGVIEVKGLRGAARYYTTEGAQKVSALDALPAHHRKVMEAINEVPGQTAADYARYCNIDLDHMHSAMAYLRHYNLIETEKMPRVGQGATGGSIAVLWPVGYDRGEYDLTPKIYKDVLEWLGKNGISTPQQISEGLKAPRHVVQGALLNLVKEGKIERPVKGSYRLPMGKIEAQVIQPQLPMEDMLKDRTESAPVIDHPVAPAPESSASAAGALATAIGSGIKVMEITLIEGAQDSYALIEGKLFRLVQA